MLTLRRSQLHRPGEHRAGTDWDVFDGEECVGRIYRDYDGRWLWSVRVITAQEALHGYASTLEAAKAAFNAAYEEWKNRKKEPPTE